MVDARRRDLMTQFKGLAMENWYVSKHLIMDKIKHLLAPGDLNALKNGEGGIVKVNGNGKIVGAYRDENGQCHFVKPVCTHVGCDLVFDQVDRVWDCPCRRRRRGDSRARLQRIDRLQRFQLVKRGKWAER